MLDGRVGAIRGALDAEGYEQLPIVSYSAKYASAFYRPFREAADLTPAFGDRRSYQMDGSTSARPCASASLDLGEGADALMVKPALPYLDVIRRARALRRSTFAYNVSGEYADDQGGWGAGWLDETGQAAIESLTAIKRAPT